jgi:Transposase DDE domain/Transposase domain (DUF772)
MGASVTEPPKRYVGDWIGRQPELFPSLDEQLDPLTAKLERLIVILDTLGMEAYVSPPGRGRGRPADDRPQIARAFVAKAVLNIPTSSALIERLQVDRSLRLICGWERRSDVPSESTFSRAFAEFAAQSLPQQVHEQLVRDGLHGHILGHVARDATEIDARETSKAKPQPADAAPPLEDPPPAPEPPRRRGRPRKGQTPPPPKPLTRIERQRTQTLELMLAELPVGCDTGCKRNSRGFTTTWVGYKLHLDVTAGMVPVSAILTSASVHDSQVAIPLARTSEQRIVWLYDVMDAAYDAEPIIADCKAAGRIAIIDRNTRRQPALKAEIAAERTACRTINMPHSDDLIYNERTAVERTNGAIKDDYGGRHLRVRGHLKVFCHLMFGVAAFTASCLLKLFEPQPHPTPA